MIAGEITTRQHTAEQIRNTVILAQADPVVAEFHKLWYSTPTTWGMTRYRGIPTLKCAFDLQMYHELVMGVKPALIIETGTAYGGSALHFADCLEMCGSGGSVVSVDIAAPLSDVTHPRITFRRGSSLDLDVLMELDELAQAGPVLVSLDSDHSHVHVAEELEAYSQFVTPGSFLVVEDTNISGHPVETDGDDGGPMAAVDAFLAHHPEFVREPLCERQLLTMHPGGWLRRLEN